MHRPFGRSLPVVDVVFDQAGVDGGEVSRVTLWESTAFITKTVRQQLCTGRTLKLNEKGTMQTKKIMKTIVCCAFSTYLVTARMRRVTERNKKEEGKIRKKKQIKGLHLL